MLSGKNPTASRDSMQRCRHSHSTCGHEPLKHDSGIPGAAKDLFATVLYPFLLQHKTPSEGVLTLPMPELERRKRAKFGVELLG